MVPRVSDVVHLNNVPSELGRPPVVGEFAVRDEDRRAPPQRAGGVADLDGDLAAGNADAQRAGGQVEVSQGRDRSGDSSGSTGACFTDTPFVYPHADCAIAGDCQHLDVHTVRELAAVEEHRRGDVEFGQRFFR